MVYMNEKVMALKYKLYYYLVTRNAKIRQEYESYVVTHRAEHATAPWKHWIKLIMLNVHYRILRRKQSMLAGAVPQGLRFPESEAIKRYNMDALVEMLCKYDVISFDVFDTLVFRPFAQPTDAFYLLEAKNGFLDFIATRQYGERIAREKTMKPHMEIDIFDIYEEVGKYYHCDPHEMAMREIEMEKQICYANPYLLELYSRLAQKGKIMIAVSDMYLPAEYIRQILDRCGYKKIDRVYVSCDQGVCKVDGSMQKFVESQYGKKKKYVHVDDSYRCVEGCRKAGWDTVQYTQCNEVGNEYRLSYLNTPVSRMYKGIVNNCIHNGTRKMSLLQEFGFVYGGILACGYCEWLTQFCRSNGCDKILFLARDTDIFFRVYKKYYHEIPAEYVTASRSALQQLVFEHYIQEFICRTIDVRADLKKKVGTVLVEADLELLKPYLDRYGLSENEIFSWKNRDSVVEMIYDHVDEIASYYGESNYAAMEYYRAMIGDAKKVCVCGLGWAGTEIVFIKYLVEKKWNLGTTIVGTLLGAQTTQRASSSVSMSVITPYAFCANKNTNLNLDVNGTPEEVVLLGMESVFSSAESSLIKYGKPQKLGELVSFVTKESSPNGELVQEFQQGVIWFVDEFFRHREPIKAFLPLTALEAYEPIYRIFTNHPYIAMTLGAMREMPKAISGNCNDKQYVTFRDLMSKYFLNVEYCDDFTRPAREDVLISKTGTPSAGNKALPAKTGSDYLDKMSHNRLLRQIIRQVGKEHDDIYIYKHHIGEIYLYLNLVKHYIKKNKSRNPILIINEERYISLYDMFTDDLETAFVPMLPYVVDETFLEEVTEYKGHRFFCPTPDRFEELRYNIFHSSKEAHFYEYIKYSMGISPYEDVEFQVPTISEKVRENVFAKAQKCGLNLQKFVIIFPEAVTASKVSMRFWKYLIELFSENGYDVFVNSRSEDYASMDAKSCSMTIAEIYYLASISQGIFALINGLVVTFALMDVPRYMLYTDQTPTAGDRMTSTKMLSAYRMDVLPNAVTDNLYELDMSKMTEDQLLRKIASDYSLEFQDKGNSILSRSEEEC